MEGDMWKKQTDNQGLQSPFYNTDLNYSNIQNQQLDFQSFNDDTSQMYYNPSQTENKSYADGNGLYPEMFSPMATDFIDPNNIQDEFSNEPPLLEELEIYPDRIIEKTLAVLNPFRNYSLADDAEFLVKDTDLAGPVSFCLTLAFCLFLSGNKAHFGYIYGLSMISCLFMYALLTVMTVKPETFTMSIVGSMLGYCLLPIVVISFLGIFYSLNSTLGISLSFTSVLWSSLSASRLFVAISGNQEQRLLIAYPCALVYGLFCLIVIF